MINVFLTAVISFFVFSLIHHLDKNKKPCKRAFLSVITGPLLLVMLNLISSYTGVIVPISPLSLMLSTTLGIPGVSVLILLTQLL